MVQNPTKTAAAPKPKPPPDSAILLAEATQPKTRTKADSISRKLREALEKGETVKLSSFGSFMVRKKGQRIGRNPKTGTEVPISPRRVMVFKPSAILKQRINGNGTGIGDAKAGEAAGAEEAAKARSENDENGESLPAHRRRPRT